MAQTTENTCTAKSPGAAASRIPAQGNPLQDAIAQAMDWLAHEQQPEGFWVGMLKCNCCMEAEWILAMHFLGVTDDPKLPGVIRAILREQRPDGSWEVYYQAPMGDINATVECYAALRCSGFKPEDEPLKKARDWILAHGGFKKTRNFTRIWLALIGEWPWAFTPVIPPEIILLPAWMPFNLYWFASWARATIVPLAIVSARRPVRRLPPERRLDELFPGGRDRFDYSIARNKTGFWPTLLLDQRADSARLRFSALETGPRSLYQTLFGVDHSPPGCGWGLGGHSASLDL